jgi:adenylylsulfate kinase-like enzyme
MADAGLVVLVPVISPYQIDRAGVRQMHTDAALTFYEVHVATPLEVCEQRDVKGMYARARTGEITGFTGVDDPYEMPEAPDLVIDTSTTPVDVCATAVAQLTHPR